jgi:hypothetical protein
MATVATQSRRNTVELSVALWGASIFTEVIGTISSYPTYPTSAQTGLLVGTLAADVVMSVLVVLMLRHNWARITLAVIGGGRVFLGGVGLLIFLANGHYLTSLLVPLLLILGVMAFATMFLPASNEWFHAAGTRSCSGAEGNFCGCCGKQRL